MMRRLTVCALLLCALALAGCSAGGTAADYPAAIMVDDVVYLLPDQPSPAEVADTFTVPLDFFRQTPPQVYSYDLIPQVPEDFPYASVGITPAYPWGRGRMEVPVWGKAAPGEEVTVKFADQSVSAKAGADGKWMVKLAPMAASASATLART